MFSGENTAEHIEACFNDEVECWRKNIKPPTRVMAPFTWMGGKGMLATKIIPFLPDSDIYCEPYLGAGSVFWHKKHSPVSVLNDVDDRIYNLFCVLKDPKKSKELIRRLTLTPYSRREYMAAADILKDTSQHNDIDIAWAFFVGQNQGFGGKPTYGYGRWGRSFSRENKESGTWRARLGLLGKWHDRLMDCMIDKVDALKCISYWDSEKTLFYLDPPYVHETRVKSSRNIYTNEPDDMYHQELVDTLLSIKGMAVISGYSNKIYDRLEQGGWEVKQFETSCHAAGRTRSSSLQGEGAAKNMVPRSEVIWISPSAILALHEQGKLQKGLFDG